VRVGSVGTGLGPDDEDAVARWDTFILAVAGYRSNHPLPGHAAIPHGSSAADTVNNQRARFIPPA